MIHHHLFLYIDFLLDCINFEPPVNKDNKNNSVTRNNLGLCKHSEIYLLENIVINLMAYRLGKGSYIKQTSDIQE